MKAEPRPAKRPDGMCRDCWSESAFNATMRLRPAPNPGPRCASHHRAVVKARKAAAQKRRDATVYGLADGGYEALLEVQEGRCAICRRATGASRRLSVDHSHATGRVRGLTCRPCNTLIGHLRDDPAAAMRIHDYLIHPPATRIDQSLLDNPYLPGGNP